jgi:hypothetical protein
LQSSGPSGLNVRVNGVFVGTPDALSAVLQPFLDAAGTPSSIFTGPEQYLHAMLVEAGCQDLTVGQCHLAGVSPDGTLDRTEFAATSTYLGAPLSSVGLAAVLQSVENLQSAVPQLGGGLVFDAYGGAINRIAPDATAFVHRHELAALQTSINWASGASAAFVTAAESWLAQTARTLDPFFGPGAYQNYIDPTLDDWAVAYYGTNLPRLVSVKHRYDPDDIFHFAQSIPPTLPA